LLAVQLSVAWNNFQFYKFPDDFQLEYTDISKKQPDAPISGVLKNNLSFMYWGDTEKLPLLQQKKIFYFSNYFQFIEYIKKKSRYYLSCWISFRNEKYFMSYSDALNNIYADLPGKKTLGHFFQPKTITKLAKWTDVYRDITGRLIVSTYKNIIDYNGRTVGLAGLDVDIDTLLKNILKTDLSDKKRLGNNSSLNKGLVPFSFVINGENSKLIAFPNNYYVPFGLPAQNFKDYDYRQELKIKLEESKYPDIKKLAKEMQEKRDGISFIKLNNEEYLVAFSKIADNNWILSEVYPVKLFFSSIAETRNEMNKRGRQLTTNFILLAVFFLLLSVFLVTRFFNRYVLDPICALRKGVVKLGKGNFDSKLSEIGVLEVKGLTRSFNKMQDELKNHMKKLECEVVERKSLETEIEVAKKIQHSILPRATAIFQRDEFDLYGELFSAKVIAGDCYDFFYLKKNKIALLIADVFGEGGISAAFYMTVLKSTIRDICLQESGDPAKALAHANRFLCDEYRVGMYVSLFLIYYDLDTGAIQYGNAGHYTALQIKKNGEYQRLGSFGNTVLGSSLDAVYKSEEKTLDVEDTLFLYTDGVIKATSQNGGYYGEDRLISFLLKRRELSSEQLCQFLFDNIKLFEGGDNTDDITMLIFKRKK
jgi:serine phosphatase RsbU (regulator of sigma subunit)